jgi:S-(hydroxymethyl)glutathione dehydrogenase / alcohol dehydrogenase
MLPRTTNAAVLFEAGRPLEIIELTIPPLQPGQILVEIDYSGICHTQLNEVRGRKGPDRFLPHTLGHEGAGHILAVGTGVSKVAVADAVVLTWIKGAGAEVPATRYESVRGPVNSGAISTFMRHTVTCENRVVKLPSDFPLREAAMLGCALPTGGGIVLNCAQQINSASDVAVFGAGGIGSSAVMVAASLGVSRLIAIDVVPAKLEFARRMGATHTIDARTSDVSGQIKEICPGGVDLAIEAAGIPAVMEMAFNAVKPGGLCMLAGNVSFGQTIVIDPSDLIKGKRIAGSWGGGTVPDRDIPRYVSMVRAGKLRLAQLISAEYSLAEINRALDDLEAGRVVRAIISFVE